jgi:hypothetical protein
MKEGTYQYYAGNMTLCFMIRNMIRDKQKGLKSIFKMELLILKGALNPK